MFNEKKMQKVITSLEKKPPYLDIEIIFLKENLGF